MITIKCLLISAEASNVSAILGGKLDKKMGSFYSLQHFKFENEVSFEDPL